MKKIISIMLCVLIILFCPIYAYAQTEEIISEIDIEHEMTSAEIDEFLLTARPISDLVSSEDKPIEEKIDSSLDRNGSYKYDAKTQQVTFESAENINLYNARAEEKTESISFGVDSEYFPKNINVSEEIGGISTFGIIGDDNRTRVKDTTKGPWCNTVRLLMKINGNNYVGSGFMIGPNSVATAGHCVYSKSNGWASSITVIPAVNGTSKPYGTATMTSMECGGNWYKDENNQDDWGIIRVNKNIGKSTGWLGLRWQSASYNNQYLYANGYPAEYCPQYFEQPVTDSNFDESSGKEIKRNENLKTFPNAEQVDSEDAIDSEQQDEPTENKNTKKKSAPIRTERPQRDVQENE